MAFILIVEDNDDVVPLEIALESVDGYKVMLATDGRHALKLIQNDPLDLAALVTDVHMPFVDGFDLVSAIRASECYAHLPIIVISGNGDPEVRNRILNLGADAFFSKPYSPAEVRNMLENLLYAPH